MSTRKIFSFPKEVGKKNVTLTKTKPKKKNKSNRKKSIARNPEFVSVYSEVAWILRLVRMKKSHITDNSLVT